MNYFQDIQSLADLKKQYRTLALANHPDRGGSTIAMQEINLQFEKLYLFWQDKQTASETVTGYEDDYTDASAKEYADYVYNEYRWRGHNYTGQSNREIIEILRQWIKETYPRYKFSVRREGYNSFYFTLLNADFAAFTPQAGNVIHMQVNHYSIRSDERLTDRAKEVLQNVYEFVKSYHFDNSNSQIDYFHTNFYINLGVGSDKHPYKIVVPQLKARKTDVVSQFKHPEGQVHKSIRQVLGKNRFAAYQSRRYGNIIVLGYDTFRENGDTDFYPLWYSARKTAQKRMDKLQAAGIKCNLTERYCGYMLFSGYTEETEKALETERQEAANALKSWKEKQTNNFLTI